MTVERLDRLFLWPTIAAALASIPLVIAQADQGPDSAAVIALDWATWSIFAAELVAYLAVVDRRAAWLRRHPLEVAIVLLTFPPLTAVLAAMRIIRVARLLRVLRVARLAAITRTAFSAQGVRYAAVLALLTAIAGGEAYANLEGEDGLTGIYWAVTTMTTVGYGDLSPETTGGRALALAVMFVGIGFVAILTGAVAERFLKVNDEQGDRRVEDLERVLLARIDELERRLAEDAQR